MRYPPRLKPTLKDRFKAWRIIRSHTKWLFDIRRGKRARFVNLNLNGYDFTNVDLTRAVFIKCSLRYADFSSSRLGCTKFIRCNLDNADFSESDLYIYETKFIKCHMRQANFCGARMYQCEFMDDYLHLANLYAAYFSECTIKCAEIHGANFTEATLDNTEFDLRSASSHTAGLFLACPEEGPFVAFKKAYYYPCGAQSTRQAVIVKLLVPANALRSSATTRKCRVSRAKVAEITSLDGKQNFDIAFSTYDLLFEYPLGGIVSVDDFDTDRWNECAKGIHCYITRQEAVNH